MLAAHGSGRLRAAIAATTAMLLVICGLLARSHKADVAHVEDARTGDAVHALGTDCNDRAPADHVHGMPGDSHDDAGACQLIGVIHQSARAAHVPAIAPALVIEATRPPSAAVLVATNLLLAAPKTSPPVG